MNINHYNELCAQFLGWELHKPDEKRRKFNEECYPTLPYYKIEYNVPIQFGEEYSTPTYLHFLYNNADKIPRPVEPIAVARMKFDSDWNWIMELIEKIEITNRKNDNEYYPYKITIWKNGCSISDGNNGNILFQNFNSLGKKEAVINAIYEFLKWYYEIRTETSEN